MTVFTELSDEIATISVAPVINMRVVESVLMNSKAIIIQAFGMGNIPSQNKNFMSLLDKAIQQDKIIVIMTQCFQGEVNDVYEAGRALVSMGAVLAYDMTMECIFAKLSYLLGKKYSISKVKTMMMQSLRGELTDLKKTSNTFSLKNNKLVQAVAEVLRVTDQDDLKAINTTLSPLLVNSVCSSGNLDLMQELAAEGADFNLVDYRGRGPIHVAAIAGNMDMIEFLIEKRVNLDFIDQTGMSALYLAIYFKNSEIVT